jgi:7,8-dihydropterin-6-yl-methyl-4-(beta-D-ribofuranosyl)aminobenzene 5'-phosphate synthase
MGNKKDPQFSIGEADRVVITTVMDNYTDVFLVESEIAKRWGPPDMVPDKPATAGYPFPLLAEHGFSLLVQGFKGDQVTTILFDTGFTEIGVPYNLKRLGIDINDVDAIVFSHGHPDHTAAIPEVLKDANKRIPIITHPFAFRKRYLVMPDGSRLLSNTLSEKRLTESGADLQMSSEFMPVAPFAAVSGEIDMDNDFELHFPLAHYEEDGQMVKDFFEDEKSLFINVKNKGLIVISGCGHRGIINTVEYARRVSGVEKIHAVIGGFHLTGTTKTEKITRTVAEMERIGPDFIIPTHCTGLKAMKFFADAMPDNFMLNAVGTTFTFEA